MTVIADSKQAVAVAGVMGGAGSEISDSTTSVLLESACFSATSVRKTAKTLGLMTDSSYRFERGVDPDLADWASRRAAQLLSAHAGGALQSGMIDVYPEVAVPGRIACRFDRVRKLTGVSISNDDIVSVLNSIELSAENITDVGCDVIIPTFRVDLHREADLIEEIIRLHGLDKIPAPAPRARVVPEADDSRTRAFSAIREHMVGLGLNEVVHYSFLSEELVDVFDPGDVPTRLILPNPISEDHTMLRNALTPQIIKALGVNRSHQIREAGIFELGRVFRVQEDGSYNEHEDLAIGLMGPIGRPGGGRQDDPIARSSCSL